MVVTVPVALFMYSSYTTMKATPPHDHEPLRWTQMLWSHLSLCSTQAGTNGIDERRHLTMAQLNPYLHFSGNCREAMTFYRECFGGELSMQTVGESPMVEHMPPNLHEQILHAMLVRDGLVLMASDMLSDEDVTRGNGVRLCLVCTSKQEIETLFARLAEGGQVEHGLEETFFGTYGDMTDQYGVGWMLQFNPTPPA